MMKRKTSFYRLRLPFLGWKIIFPFVIVSVCVCVCVFVCVWPVLVSRKSIKRAQSRVFNFSTRATVRVRLGKANISAVHHCKGHFQHFLGVRQCWFDYTTSVMAETHNCHNRERGSNNDTEQGVGVNFPKKKKA